MGKISKLNFIMKVKEYVIEKKYKKQTKYRHIKENNSK